MDNSEPLSAEWQARDDEARRAGATVIGIISVTTSVSVVLMGFGIWKIIELIFGG